MKKQYLCVVRAWHNGTVYRRDEVYELRDDELPRDKDGKVIHFVLMEDFEKASEGKWKSDEEKTRLEAVLAYVQGKGGHSGIA